MKKAILLPLVLTILVGPECQGQHETAHAVEPPINTVFTPVEIEVATGGSNIVFIDGFKIADRHTEKAVGELLGVLDTEFEAYVARYRLGIRD